LVQDGIISLDDQITDLVPEITIQNRWSDQSPVLLRHLLEHTSGFRDLYIQDFVADEEMPLPSMEESIQRRPDYWVSRWEPGTRHAYSNPGYSLLGVIINKFSGRNYDQYLKDILLDPLLMKNSDFLGRNVTNLAMSYDKKGNPQVPSPLFDHSAGFLHSTPRDMARFVQFMLNEGSVHNNLKVLDPEIFHKMESPSSIIGADLGLIGYGMANYAIVSRGFIGYGHNGGLQEYLSSYVYFPDSGNGYYFTLTNSNFEAYEAVSKLFQSYCLPVRKKIKAAGQDLMTDNQVLGWYRSESYRTELAKFIDDILSPVQIEMNNDSLFIRSIMGDRKLLYSVKDNVYRLEESPEPTHFIGNHNGRMVISSSYSSIGGYYEKDNLISVLWKTVSVGLFLGIFTIVGVSIPLLSMIRFFKSKKNVIENRRPVYYLFLGFLMIGAYFFSFSQLYTVHLIATANFYSISLAVSTGLFGLLFVAGLWSFKHGSVNPKRWVRYSIYATFTCWAGLNLFLLSYGVLPLITWRW
jgi:CubicO group peptidase (beta-lactamase class C family)